MVAHQPVGAGSTITATRWDSPVTREAPWSTTQVPERDSTPRDRNLAGLVGVLGGP
jgi:hypothetical protein